MTTTRTMMTTIMNNLTAGMLDDDEDNGGDCSFQAKFTKQNASVADSGNYECVSATSGILINGDVYVFAPPKMPELHSLTCTSAGVVTFVFNTTEPDHKIRFGYKYEVFLKRRRSSSLVCNDSQVIRQDELCSCTFVQKSPSDGYTLLINVSRPMNSVEKEIPDVNLIKRILPEAVGEVIVSNVSSSGAVAHLYLTNNLTRLYQLMYEEGFPLVFELVLTSLSGNSEEFAVNVIAEYIGDNPFDYDLYRLEVRLDHLKAFTDYNLSVISYGGGGRGESRRTIFRSSQTAPTRPPDHFYFSADSLEVTLIWQPLPHEAVGGDSLRYIVHVFNESDHLLVNESTDKTYLVLPGVPRVRLYARIWSTNIVGLCPNFTALVLPLDSDESVEVQVEFSMESRRAAVFASVQGKSVEKIALHWCQDHKNTSSYTSVVCTEFPYTHIIEQSGPLLQYNLSLAEESRETSSVESIEVEVVYWNWNSYDDKSQKERIGLTVNGTLRIKIRELKLVSGSQSEFTPQAPSGLAGGYDSLSVPASVAGDREAYPIVAMSIFSADQWLGMVPTRCYFDKGIDDVTLRISVPTEEKVPYLYISQDCHPDQPRQCLVSRFLVFKSPDERCDHGLKQLYSLENSPLTTTKVRLEETGMFLCVQAICGALPGYREWWSTLAPQFVPNAFSDTGGDSTIFSSLAPVLAVVALVVIIICVIIVIKRRRAFSKVTGEDLFKGARRRVNVSSLESPPPDPPKGPPPLPKKEPDDSLVICDDSGQGTGDTSGLGIGESNAQLSGPDLESKSSTGDVIVFCHQYADASCEKWSSPTSTNNGQDVSPIDSKESLRSVKDFSGEEKEEKGDFDDQCIALENLKLKFDSSDNSSCSSRNDPGSSSPTEDQDSSLFSDSSEKLLIPASNKTLPSREMSV
ncbi:uncharacterized protein LOC101851905 [Aplysia californica]|uniref:Uncharacterized protein LOC101851905 n=1 Tax=Aplysia californica TaxID=6500 RepID=A0ABM0JB39_APLCA|nr:uncharacterized protein LOC101851905 [Aplysia californica]